MISVGARRILVATKLPVTTDAFGSIGPIGGAKIFLFGSDLQTPADLNPAAINPLIRTVSADPFVLAQLAARATAVATSELVHLFDRRWAIAWWMNIAVNILRRYVPQIWKDGMFLQKCIKSKSTTFEDPNRGSVARVAMSI